MLVIVIGVTHKAEKPSKQSYLPKSVPANLGDISWGVTGVPALPNAFILMAIIMQKIA